MFSCIQIHNVSTEHRRYSGALHNFSDSERWRLLRGYVVKL